MEKRIPVPPAARVAVDEALQSKAAAEHYAKKDPNHPMIAPNMQNAAAFARNAKTNGYNGELDPSHEDFGKQVGEEE